MISVNALPSEPASVSGWLTILWGDPLGSGGQPQTIYMLTDDTGHSAVLQVDEALAQSLGGMLSFDRKHVAVVAESSPGLSSPSSPSVLRVKSIALDPLTKSSAASPKAVSAVTGSQPWISILCKFNDFADEPRNLAFFQGMYASTAPGLDHYWREQSYGVANVAGSNAAGWFTLPRPRSYYVYDRNGDGFVELDLQRSVTDCTGAADPSVNFPQYIGINMMFNTDLDGYARGGGWYLTLDGVSKFWSLTWEPPWGYQDISVIEHEMGHGFGLPHSSGNYGNTYDNAWDVMSWDRYNCWGDWDPTYGCIGQHTISYHKDRLGWIPPSRKFTFMGGSTTITLEQLAQPATGNYLMAQIPIGGSATHFYTLEARRLVGYDIKLPGAAVIIHDVDTTRGDGRPAHVIDIDGNGDTSDAGAMWVPGETFTDAANGIFVRIDSATATGFVVTIIQWSTWVGGVSVTSDRTVVAVGRPHVGDQVMTYDSFAAGSTTSYLPMLFKNAWGSYDSAFYVQNVDSINPAHVTVKYYDTSGTLTCTKPVDTIPPLSSHGIWVPAESNTCLPVGWVGGAVVTSSDYPIVAVARPHVGSEVMTYNGFASGSATAYLPMLFKNAFGGSYDSAFYIQNVDASNPAHVTVKYYDTFGTLTCTKPVDTIPPLSSHGIWVPAEAADCLPVGWVGGAVISSADSLIVAVARPHIGSSVTAYDGFASGSSSSYVPMLFKNAFGGSYDSAFYVQNLDSTHDAHVTVKYYDTDGILTCTKPVDTIPPMSSHGIWVPSESCLPVGWVGAAVVTSSDYPVVAVGRPHVGSEVMAYGGFTGGGLAINVPMLFKNAFGGSYNSAFYIQNTDPGGPASVTVKFYDTNGILSCQRTDSIPALATQGYWLPSVTCNVP